MNIVLTTSEHAHLANRRLRIVQEACAEAPWKHNDLVFNPYGSEVNDQPLYDPEGKEHNLIATRMVSDGYDTICLHTTAERVKELCGDDPKFLTEEGLEKLCWAPEKEQIEDWIHGRNFGIVLEEWNDAQRKFKPIDNYYGITGVKELIENIKDYLEPGMVVCADEEAACYLSISKKPN